MVFRKTSKMYANGGKSKKPAKKGVKMQYGGVAEKKKTKGMRNGGLMKSKGMRNGGPMKSKGYKKGGKASK
jgi:hypothetical protein